MSDKQRNITSGDTLDAEQPIILGTDKVTVGELMAMLDHAKTSVEFESGWSKRLTDELAKDPVLPWWMFLDVLLGTHDLNDPRVQRFHDEINAVFDWREGKDAAPDKELQRLDFMNRLTRFNIAGVLGASWNDVRIAQQRMDRRQDREGGGNQMFVDGAKISDIDLRSIFARTEEAMSQKKGRDRITRSILDPVKIRQLIEGNARIQGAEASQDLFMRCLKDGVDRDESNVQAAAREFQRLVYMEKERQENEWKRGVIEQVREKMSAPEQSKWDRVYGIEEEEPGILRKAMQVERNIVAGNKVAWRYARMRGNRSKLARFVMDKAGRTWNWLNAEPGRRTVAKTAVHTTWIAGAAHVLGAGTVANSIYGSTLYPALQYAGNVLPEVVTGVLPSLPASIGVGTLGVGVAGYLALSALLNRKRDPKGSKKKLLYAGGIAASTVLGAMMGPIIPALAVGGVFGWNYLKQRKEAKKRRGKVA